MARGPLPDPNAKRRNAPTIPTTKLPAGGVKLDPPPIPEGYELGAAGFAFWEWAWHTPQAAAWDDGAIYAVARRAVLENDLRALGTDYHDVEATLADLLGLEPDSSGSRIREIIDVFAGLKRAAGGEATIMREMRELDERLGLTPKALAALRWTIVKDEAAASPEEEKAPTRSRSKSKAKGSPRSRLTANGAQIAAVPDPE